LTLQLEVKCGIPLYDLVFQYLSSISDAFVCEIVHEGKTIIPGTSYLRSETRIFLVTKNIFNDSGWKSVRETRSAN
jgi:hypothetical protein